MSTDMNPDEGPAYSSTVDLPISADEAFALVTEPERLRRWTSVCATVDLRAGGSWHWQVTPSHTAGGTIREVDPGLASSTAGGGWGTTSSHRMRRPSP